MNAEFKVRNVKEFDPDETGRLASAPVGATVTLTCSLYVGGKRASFVALHNRGLPANFGVQDRGRFDRFSAWCDANEITTHQAVLDLIASYKRNRQIKLLMHSFTVFEDPAQPGTLLTLPMLYNAAVATLLREKYGEDVLIHNEK